MLPSAESLEGKRVPNVTFKTRTSDQWKDVTTDDVFKSRTVVVFSLPGAYTPTCSSTHSHGYRYDEITLGKHITSSTLRAVSGSGTWPQVFIDGKLIGSADELERYFGARKAA